MQIIISPAKTLDFETKPKISEYTQPEFLEQSCELVDQLKQLTPDDLASLMKLSDKLALLNYERYQSWRTPFTPENSKQCVYAFKGDVYTGLEVASLDKADIDFAQNHLKILSGLYGLLRPLDLIQPYRLEMGTPLKNPRGDNLYRFWGNLITQKLNDSLEENPVLINLASNEYSKAVNFDNLDADVITPIFKDKKNDEYKLISFYAKKARGLMSRFIITHRITKPDQIKAFDLAGYRFSPSLSKEREWVFTRDAPA